MNPVSDRARLGTEHTHSVALVGQNHGRVGQPHNRARVGQSHNVAGVGHNHIMYPVSYKARLVTEHTL